MLFRGTSAIDVVGSERESARGEKRGHHMRGTNNNQMSRLSRRRETSDLLNVPRGTALFTFVGQRLFPLCSPETRVTSPRPEWPEALWRYQCAYYLFRPIKGAIVFCNRIRVYNERTSEAKHERERREREERQRRATEKRDRIPSLALFSLSSLPSRVDFLPVRPVYLDNPSLIT